ncbi:uncharacterized protein B0H64DRAFT_374261 [Chaetomium fimeti]|uniref:Protein kinase domain-containing protein n=1 Tax=Chaetomium fimeti TaxID=1854472 RepID=A0AAE0HGP6_9PEZI|nr:hypothetical protein B0H64DRAFT_374261 [Chaetomium fimeti]
MRRRHEESMRARKPWVEAAQTPFRDDALMDGTPGCTAADFELPRLRRCPFDADKFIWGRRLGEGLDGCVWKVWSGDAGPFVLKVFWDDEPPEFAHYYAPQRECQVAALLQMMEAAVEQAAAASRPVVVNANPTTRDDALDNQAAFSDEARLEQQSSAQQEPGSGYRQITTMPRVKKCYGWLTLKSSVFTNLPWELKPPVIKVDKVERFIQPGKEYMAIVYEYVEEGENTVETLQEAMDFFWLAGFCRTLSPLLKNWKSSVLVDLCDVAPPRGYGWVERLYSRGPTSAPLLLKQAEFVDVGPPMPRPPRASQLARFRTPLPRKQVPPARSPSQSPTPPPLTSPSASPSPPPTKPTA